MAEPLGGEQAIPDILVTRSSSLPMGMWRPLQIDLPFFWQPAQL
jgi:hypothetical protein